MPQAKVQRNKPVKFTSYGDKVGVRDCLVWRGDPSNKNKHTVTPDFFLPKKGEIGKPMIRGYEPIDPSVAFHVKPGSDDHVIDALRGWPGKPGDFLTDSGDFDLYRETPTERQARERSANKTKKKKGNTKKHVKQIQGDGLPDPFMGDLISHKFMKEAALQRDLKNKQAIEAARIKAKLEYAKKFPKDIKATKASQLRSIAKAEKITSDPMSLWQMSRFRENAEPLLDTFRKGKSSGDQAKNKSAEKAFDTCTCTEENGLGQDQPMYTIDNYPEPELEFTKIDDHLMGETED